MKRFTVMAALLLVSAQSFAERFEASGRGQGLDKPTACERAKDDARRKVASTAASGLHLYDPSKAQTGECLCDKDKTGYATCTVDAWIITKDKKD